MNKFMLIGFLVVCAAGYLVYQRWQQQAQLEFCQKMWDCTSQTTFAADYGDLEQCENSERGELDTRLYRDCDIRLPCRDWLICGKGIEMIERGKVRVKPASNFDEVLPHLELDRE